MFGMERCAHGRRDAADADAELESALESDVHVQGLFQESQLVELVYC